MSKKDKSSIGLLRDKKPCVMCKDLTRLYSPKNGESICINCYVGVKK